MNQLYVYIYAHIPSLLCFPYTLPIPPLEVVTKYGAALPVLYGCYPLGIFFFFFLAIYFTFGSLHMSMLLSHFVPAYPSPSWCPQLNSLLLNLYSCPVPRRFRTFFFRFHIYVSAYSICFSLSDLLHSVWQTLGPSTLLQITQFRFILWLSNIPLYIHVPYLLYPFICWWTLRLLPCTGYCK